MIGWYKKETTPIMIITKRCGKHKHVYDKDVNIPKSSKVNSFKPVKPFFL